MTYEAWRISYQSGDMRPDSAPLDQDCEGEDGSHWPSDVAWRGNYTMEPLTPNASVRGESRSTY